MQIKINDPPREFIVGKNNDLVIKDCAHVSLDFDEQVTFETDVGGEYDVARKEWGFYLTPSINGRLVNHGFKTALIRNSQGNYYLFLVEQDKQQSFYQYLEDEGLAICGWFNQGSLKVVEQALKNQEDQEPNGDRLAEADA